VTLNRRQFLVAAAGTVGSLQGLTGMAAATRVRPRTAAVPRYTWRKGAMDGGGFCNAIATDPHRRGRVAAAGDVWGEFATDNFGDFWYPTMTGATSIGEIYGRAAAFSHRVPGLRYFGIGVLKNAGSHNGCLAVVAPGSLKLERRNTHVNFSTYMHHGAAGDMPRPVGNLIAVDHDPATGIEYLYALTRQGLMRSTDAGATFTPLGLPAVAPTFAWSALCLCPDGSLLAASYRTGDTHGSQVWRVRTPRHTATVTVETGAPAVVEDIATVDGRVFAACGTFGLRRVTSRGWIQVAPGVFNGCHLSSVAGGPGVLWVGNGLGTHDHRYIARSTNAGRTFTWMTMPANVRSTVWGTSRTWWLASAWPGLDKHGYSVSQLAVDPVDPRICYSAGRSGVWATRDGGATWRPAMHGLDGSEVQQVQVRSALGGAWAADTDWKAIETSNHWRTCARTDSRAPSPDGHRPSLVRSSRAFPGVHCSVSLSNPRRMMIGGVDVANDYFRSACINPCDLAVSRDGYLYVGLMGGGVLVGTPR
jgi:hypothetical protein